MPKQGLTDKQWHTRLQHYASGTFKFGRGQKPSKGSEWAKKLESIDACPKHRNKSLWDPLKRPIPCKCGFHSVSMCDLGRSFSLLRS